MSNMIHLCRTVLDCIKTIQDELLAVSCPLAGNSCLNRHQHGLWPNFCMTHQHIPLLYVMDSMNTNFKVSCEDQDLNPRQETSCKEVFNCPLHILSAITAARNLCKMVCPELTCIFQGIPNVGSPECGKILDITEDSMVIQLADVLP